MVPVVNCLAHFWDFCVLVQGKVTTAENQVSHSLPTASLVDVPLNLPTTLPVLEYSTGRLTLL